ncbi:MAG: ABC transporter ATP-binding protein [Pseudomonadota bacterium]
MQRLDISGLKKSYGARRAVDDVSVSVAEGQVTCLLGHSGCGKSTTLRIVAGVETEDAGDVRIDGVSLKGVPPEQRGVGLMFQDFALFPHLRVGDNVAYGIRDKRQARKRVETLLDRVGMGRFINHYPHELSGGEQQRVALVRALAPRPRVILMDEPFSGLDERLRDSVRDETLAILRDEGAAVLLVTHDPAEAMRMADEVVLMRHGRIVQRGAPYNIFNAPADLEVARFFSDINVISSICEGALVQTAFGAFLAPGHPDGTRVDIVIRPQHLRIDFNRAGDGPRKTDMDGQPVRATVARARFMGLYSAVDFDVPGQGLMTATVPGVFTPQTGTPFYLTVPRKHCRIFAQG